MSEQTPEAAEARAVLRYNGDTPVALVGSANPIPATVEPGELVVVDRWAVDPLTADAFSTVAGEALDAELKALGESTTGSADDKRARLAAAEQQRVSSSTTDDDQEQERSDDE